MKRMYHFKSLPMVPDPSGDPGKISYDMENVRDHAMEFTFADFILCRSWITNFFIALMAVIIVFALAYGALVLGMKVDMGPGGTARGIFMLIMALSFIALWAMLGIPAAFRNLKWDFTVRERGKGNWKIIDDAGWEKFLKMRKLEKDRQKKEEEFRSVQ
jgi:hypothetical protein